MERAASATASSTEGSGGYGFSFDEILYAVSAAGRPGTYRGIEERTARSRGPTASSVLMPVTVGRGARIRPGVVHRRTTVHRQAGEGSRDRRGHASLGR